MPGCVLGTPDYISPEQARGGTVDFRADQYALGGIIYEMLCGSVPFSATTLIGLLRKHLSEPPIPLSQRAPERKIPPSLDALVLRLLSKNPDQRFASMQAVAQALEQESERLRRGAPRRSAATVLAAVLGGGALFGLPLVLHYRPSPPSEQLAEPEPAAAELVAARAAAVATLRQQLTAAERELRYAALGALAQCRDTTLWEPVAALLGAPDADLAEQAAATLGQLGDRRPLPALRLHLASAPPRVRLSIARALIDLGDETGRQVLAAVLSSEGAAAAETRLQAAYLLCDTDDAAAQRLLGAIAELPTTQSATVLDILTCLGRSSQPTAARQQLLSRFHAHHGADRIPLAARLAQLGEREGRDFLRELATRPGPEQLAAACALAAPAEEELAPLFRRTLRARTDAATRALATAGLGLVGAARDVPGLVQQLAREAAPALRRTTAVAILSICSREPASLSENSLGWVRQALEDPSWAVRADAVAVLAHSPDSQAVLLLGRMLGDSVPEVRAGAVRALGLRRERSALLALRAGLADRDASVRSEVIKALVRLGRYLRSHGMAEVWQEIAAWLPGSRETLALTERQQAALLLVLKSEAPSAAAALPPPAAEQRSLPQDQRLLLELGFSDRTFLTDCLKSPDFSTRLLAAGRLAASQDSAGRPVLDEAVQRGGAEAITAYGLLAKLGQPVPAAPLAAGLDVAAPVSSRLAVVAAAAALPTEQAQALWQQAAHDPDREVRRAVVEAVGESASEGPLRWAAPVLRTLLRDADPRIRAQAAALLARILVPGGSGRELSSAPAAVDPPPEPSRGSPPDLAVAAAVANPSDTPGPPPELGAEAGKGPDAGAATPGGPTAPFEQALREGLAAGKHQDFVRAQKLLLRARSLCTALHPAPERCRSLIPEATWQLAQLHEQQRHQPEAMAEYQRLTKDRQFAGLGVDRQLAAQKAIVRLSLQLGQVVLSSRSGSRCHQEIQWLTPGPKTVIVGGKPLAVFVHAGERQEVGDCR